MNHFLTGPMKSDLTELIAEARRLQEGGKRPKYPVDFKRKAVKASQDYSAIEMINVLGIGRSTLEKWRRLYGSKTQGPKAKSSAIDFVPVIPPSQTASPEVEFQLDFSDERGRRLSMRMPWRAELADSLLQFVSQMTGGLTCFK